MKYIIGGDNLKYKIGYKKNGLWRYIMLAGNVEDALKMVEDLFTIDCDRVTIKLLKSEV